MKRLNLSKEQLAELHKRHAEYLLSRFASETGRRDLARALQAAWRSALTLRIRDVAEPARIAGSVMRALSDSQVGLVLAPLGRELAERVVDQLKRNESLLGDHVPADARAAIEKILERPDIVPDELVREVLAQEAVEHALRDVLFDGLKQFNDTANPFFAEWGIPSLLSWMPIGGAAVRASLDKIRAEFDGRLDPEIRKFLLVFSRQATTRLADVLLARGNDPYIIAMRRHVVTFVYALSLEDLAAVLDDHTMTHVETASQSIVEAALRGGMLQSELQAGLEAFAADHGEQTIGEWMTSIGVAAEPDVDAWIDVVWPLVARVVEGPEIRALVEEITGEFYATLAR